MTKQPERIHGWMNSQLSIARHYGGISFNGARYIIAHDEPGKPLVRQDVLLREKRQAKREKPANGGEQGVLI